MVNEERVPELVRLAERVGRLLSAFRTPGNNEPVDPSRVEEVARYIRASRDREAVKTFFALYGNSHMSRMSRSAAPQIAEVRKVLERELERCTTWEEQLYVVRWVARLLRTQERGFGDAPRGGPSRPTAPYRPGGRR